MNDTMIEYVYVNIILQIIIIIIIIFISYWLGTQECEKGKKKERKERSVQIVSSGATGQSDHCQAINTALVLT